MVKVVIVEDEPDISDALAHNLRREGFKVWQEFDGVAGLERIRSCAPDVVLLDVMLPRLDGLEVCRSIKGDPVLREICVIMVTARGEESDLVVGLALGADDYVRKPFRTREVVARVHAVMRRGRLAAVESDSARRCGEVLLDPQRHEVLVNALPIQLTATEFRLLHVLMSGDGRVFTRDQLLNKVIGDNAVVIDRNIDVHIRAIRRKIGPARDLIKTIRGVGYRMRLTAHERS